MGTKLNWDKSNRKTLTLKRGVETLNLQDATLARSQVIYVAKQKAAAKIERNIKITPSSWPAKIPRRIKQLNDLNRGFVTQKAKREKGLKSRRKQLLQLNTEIAKLEKELSQIDTALTQNNVEIEKLESDWRAK